MDLNFLWPLLGGAVGAAVVNSAFGFFKHGREAALEHEQWRRNQRQAGYANYLRAAAVFQSAMLRTRDRAMDFKEAAEALADAQDAYSLANEELHMLAPHQLIAASANIKDKVDVLLAILLAELRSEVEDQAAWKAATSHYIRAVSDFVVLARHDVGLLEDNRGKTRDAIEKALEVHREAQLARELRPVSGAAEI